MGVGFDVGGIVTEVGTPEFLHAFFSTVSSHLEPGGWGSRFPELMNELYQTSIPAEHAEKALESLSVIRAELSAVSPNKVVWDIDNPSKQPPWGDKISSHITSLANYFVTSGGSDLIQVLAECLQFQIAEQAPMSITKTPPWSGQLKGAVVYGVDSKPR